MDNDDDDSDAPTPVHFDSWQSGLAYFAMVVVVVLVYLAITRC